MRFAECQHKSVNLSSISGPFPQNYKVSKHPALLLPEVRVGQTIESYFCYSIDAVTDMSWTSTEVSADETESCKAESLVE
jgi:hypothetical protein